MKSKIHELQKSNSNIVSKTLFTAIATFVMISSFATIQKKSVKTNKLSVEVFKGKSASVNSYLFSNGKSSPSSTKKFLRLYFNAC